MHYTLVHGDPPKTSGPLIPFLWLICLGSIPLLIPDLPHCCPINLLGLCINDSLLLCSDSSLDYWCSHVISITLFLLHFYILLSWWLTPLPINLVMQLTHAFTQQLIRAPYAYSFLLIPCLLIAYKALRKPLPITYQSLTNSAYALPFLYFNAVSPYVFKPLGSAQWKKNRAQLHEIIPLSVSPSQYPLSSLSLVGFSEGLKALIFKFYSIYSSPSLSLGSSGV